MNIVHVASEVYPFMKTGGLADMVAALAKSLASYGHSVSVFLPGYRSALEHHSASGSEKVLSLQVEMGGEYHRGHVMRLASARGPTVYFICKDEYFDRRHPYGTAGHDYEDNAARFIFFSRAVVESLRLLKLAADVVHCHDWQTGLVPLLLRAEERKHRLTLAVRTVFTIHNIAFQGVFPMSVFGLTGLPDELLGIDGLEFYGQLSMMKGGILFSDRLTTVSPSYAREILESEHGAGLDGVLASRAGDLSGLINGIDADVWNPETDTLLPAQFSAADLSGKKICREHVFKEFGLDPSKTAPLFGMVGRLTEQKGVHLFLHNAGFFARTDARIAIVGVGEERFHDALASLAHELPGKVAFLGGIDEPKVHLLVAGADYFLMPSIFEPCGLTQLYAMRYGTIPFTSAVGGLLDTVVDLNRDPANATGVCFPPTEAGLHDALEVSLALHADSKKRRELMLRGMQKDFGWDTAARAYEKLYQEAV